MLSLDMGAGKVLPQLGMSEFVDSPRKAINPLRSEYGKETGEVGEQEKRKEGNWGWCVKWNSFKLKKMLKNNMQEPNRTKMYSYEFKCSFLSSGKLTTKGQSHLFIFIHYPFYCLFLPYQILINLLPESSCLLFCIRSLLLRHVECP